MAGMSFQKSRMTDSMRYRLKLLLIVPILALVSALQPIAIAQYATLKDMTSISISSEKKEYLEGLNFSIDVKFKNLTSSPVAVPRRQYGLHLRAFDEAGKELNPDSSLSYSGQTDTVTLAGNEQVTVPIETYLFDNNTVAGYSLMGGRLSAGVYIFQAYEGDLFSDSLRIRILPPSPADDSVRALLVSRVMWEKDREKGLQFAEELIRKFPHTGYKPEVYNWLFLCAHWSPGYKHEDELMSFALNCLDEYENTVYANAALKAYVAALKSKYSLHGEMNSAQLKQVRDELSGIDANYPDKRVGQYIRKHLHLEEGMR